MKRVLAGLLLAGIAFGADANELYYLVFLRPAAERKALPPAEMERIQTAHMANIRSMAERGVLVAAGPFGDTPPTISGVFVFVPRRSKKRAESRPPTPPSSRTAIPLT